MSNLVLIRDKAVAVITSVVTIAVAVSQAGAEIVGQLTAWDGQLVNLVALVPAIFIAIRRVTPVAKDERGLT